MRPKALAVISAIALVALLASAAAAQYESSDRSAVGFRMCMFKPTGKGIKAIKSSWIGPMVDWNVKFDKADQPSLIVSGGWFSQDGQYPNGDLAKGQMTPITATYIRHFAMGKNKNEGNNDWYAGGGLGVYVVTYDRTYVNQFQVVKDSGQLLGVHAVVGRELGPWFAELEMSKVGELSLTGGGTADFSGWSISMGSHFTF